MQDIIYAYGSLAAKDDIETVILLYSDDYTELNVDYPTGCGFKVRMNDVKEIGLLQVKIEDYGWVQFEKKTGFKSSVGLGDVIDSNSITSSAAFQDLVSKTLTKPYTLHKVLITFVGSDHHIKILKNSDTIAEYMVNHLVIDYPPIISGTSGDVIKIQIKKLAGDNVTCVGYLYGDED